MPSDSQEINIDVNSNDSDNAKGNERNDNSPGGGYPAERERVNVNGRNDNSPHGDYQVEPEPAMVNERDDSSPDITIIKEGERDDAFPESVYPAEKEPPVAPDGLTADQKQAFDMRDFLKQPPQVPTESGLSPLHQTLPYIDEPVGSERLSDEESPIYRDTEDMLNNAACRLRRWRAASRKLRRPRIINNLGDKGVCGGGRTDLADRLAAGAGAELASLAPPPPAATAPPSPGCMLSPTLADQSAADYFGSSPECYADTIGFENNAGAGAPAPPPGPRYKLATEGALRVCCFLHTRTVVDKILAAKFLRRWETHVLCLLEDHIVSKTPSGLLEKSLSYSLMQEVYCISRWDLARKYCLRIVMPTGSLLLQANDAYTRDQWYHSIIWRRNMIRYKNFLTKSIRKEVAIKELKNMVDFVMTTPLQDEIVTRAPMKLLTDLLAEEKDAPDWEEWAETATSAAAPLLAERCASGELCALLARLCKQRPRAAPLPALAPPVRRVLTRNVDFARAPNARQLVKDYISALSAHNSGSSLVRRFVEVTHGSRATCPHPRAAPNLAAVALAAIDDYYRFTPLPHQCKDDEDEVLCFADILEHMCEYEDWLITVSGVLQPVPLCPGAMACPRVATRLAQVLSAMMRDRRCAAHGGLAPAHALRPSPPSWLKAAAPSDPAIAMPHKELCRLWGNMLGSLLDCCCKRKSFLQSMSKQLPDFLLVALTEHSSAIEALCLMLEWEVGSGEQTQLEIIAALKGTCLGYQCYQDLCTRQQNLLKLQSEGGPRRLALPVRATDADVAALLRCGALGNLECLSLAFTSVTCACAHSLIQLPSLRYLNLWATQFGDRGLLLLAEHLPRLQVLNLCETRVSDRGIEALAGLPSLRRLNLNSTKLSAEAFANLRQKLPQLQEYDVRYTEAW